AQAGGLMVDEGEDGVWLYFVDASKASPSSNARSDRAESIRSAEVKRVSVRRGEGIIGQAMRSNEAQHMPTSTGAAGGGGGLTPLDGDPESGPVSWRLGSLLGLNVTSAIAMPLE